MKKILINIVVLAVVLIPTYIAVHYYSQQNSDVMTSTNTVEVKVITPDGTENVMTERRDIRFYTDALMNAEVLESTGRPIELEDPIRVILSNNSRSAEYMFYLSSRVNDCLVKAPDGTILRLKESTAKELLQTDISDTLYTVGNLPSASIIIDDNTTAIFPDTYEWTLKKGDKYLPSSLQATTKPENSVRIFTSSTVDLKFETQPDILDIEIQNGPEVLFDGMYDDFINFKYDRDSKLKYVIKAEWSKKEDSDFAGSASYIFDVAYDVPAIFTLSSNTAKPGDMLIISAKNINNGETIMATTDTGVSTLFINTADQYTCLLPIGVESSGKEVNVTVTSSDNPTPIVYTINVEALADNKPINYGTSDEMLSARRNSTTAAERASHLQNMTQIEEPKKLWSQSFIKPNGGDVIIPYGARGTYNGGHHYVSQGMEIDLVAGSPVVASNSGKVVWAAPLNETGITIVIEHGFGVKTWYCHLESMDVNAGDIVEKGQEIGKGGKTGFVTSMGNHLYFAVSIRGIFINPQYLFDNIIEGVYTDEEADALRAMNTFPSVKDEEEATNAPEIADEEGAPQITDDDGAPAIGGEDGEPTTEAPLDATPAPPIVVS